MLDSTGTRQLAYVVIIDNILPIEGSDNCECAVVGGWRVMVRKDEFKPGDPGIYFEIDSYLDPKNEKFSFMKGKKYKVKTQKYTFGGKGNFISQGLLMSAADFGWSIKFNDKTLYIQDDKGVNHIPNEESAFLSKQLNVTYYVAEDNKRKASFEADKYKAMAQRNGKRFARQPYRWLMKRTWGKKILFIFFGKKKDKNLTAFPTKFQFVKKTDQERCENMPWVLNDKTPFIKTQKCDGSSATYILERKKFNKFEFYVCSRNVRQLDENQECFHKTNVYWECARKYDIENKLKDYLIKNPDLKYICWQGEVCGPDVQGNPHGLSELHLFCFHMIDSKQGKYDILKANYIWINYDMEVVPIVDVNYIMPNDFNEFKDDADGFYDPACCEGKESQMREGFVYYKTDDPNFSFKNVSKQYLLSRYE